MSNFDHMLKLFSKISLVVLLTFLLSIGLDYFYRDTYGIAYKFPQNILPHAEIADKYKLVKLGNSHSEDGLTFEKYNIKSLNLASVAQTYEYDLAHLKMHERQIDKGAIIIIHVSPISFSQKKPEKKADINTMYYDGRLSPFLIPHFDMEDYMQMQLIPFVRTGYLWRTSYAEEAKEKGFSGFVSDFEKKQAANAVPTPILAPQSSPSGQVDLQVLLRTETQPFNVSEILAVLNAHHQPSDNDKKLEESMHFMVNKWDKSGGFDTESFASNRKDLQDIIDYCLEHNWRPVLVTLPINQILLDGLGPGYLDHYIYSNLEQVDLHGTKYINFATNPQLTTNNYLYSNTDHLNPKGASIASYLLLQQLIDMGYLERAVDGYDYTPREIWDSEEENEYQAI